MLGLGQMGQTSDNLIRTRECVINLASEALVTHVDRLALTTGKNPVPERKRQWGYRYEPDKFGIAGFTAMESEAVAPPRVRECPVQMEGIVHDFRPFGKNVSANISKPFRRNRGRHAPFRGRLWPRSKLLVPAGVQKRRGQHGGGCNEKLAWIMAESEGFA